MLAFLFFIFYFFPPQPSLKGQSSLSSEHVLRIGPRTAAEKEELLYKIKPGLGLIYTPSLVANSCKMEMTKEF